MGIKLWEILEMKNKTAIHYDLNFKNGKEKLFIGVSKKKKKLSPREGFH